MTFPDWSKPILRFARYPEERARFFRERKLVRLQDHDIHKHDASIKSLIIFLVPGADHKTGKDQISGGVLSLVSLYEETSKLGGIHKSVTIMCTFPGEWLLVKHENFENNSQVFRFNQISDYFTALDNVIIHIPEYLVPFFEERLSKQQRAWLNNISHLHINIINANILLMPSLQAVQRLKSIAGKLTMTAAHSSYCTMYYRNFYGVPLHKFSAWISPEQYIRKPYNRKRNLIVVSPDGNEHRENIVNILKQESELEIKVLQGLRHTEFKDIISEAKWALTFGEGLDGYILEPIFSGAIGFAVYNQEFFTEDFKKVEGIYADYKTMAERMLKDIKAWDNQEAYSEIQNSQFAVCAKHYNFNEYRNNIRKFYEGDYSFA